MSTSTGQQLTSTGDANSFELANFSIPIRRMSALDISRWTRQHSHGASFYLPTASDPAPIEAQIRKIVFRTDQDLPVTGLGTMQEKVDASIFQQRLLAALASSMAFLALLMSGTGLYGVLSYIVAQRTREIGIRIALGATPGNVTSLVLRRLNALMITGIMFDYPLIWIATRALSSVAAFTVGVGWLIAGSGIFVTARLRFGHSNPMEPCAEGRSRRIASSILA